MKLLHGKPTRSMARLTRYLKVLRRAKRRNPTITPLPAIRRGKNDE